MHLKCCYVHLEIMRPVGINPFNGSTVYSNLPVWFAEVATNDSLSFATDFDGAMALDAKECEAVIRCIKAHKNYGKTIFNVHFHTHMEMTERLEMPNNIRELLKL